jgi:hypothetical protein
MEENQRQGVLGRGMRQTMTVPHRPPRRPSGPPPVWRGIDGGGTQWKFSSPEVLKPIRCQLRVPNGVLDVFVAKPSLQRPGIVARVRQPCRSMCGWIENAILARAPIRPNSAWKALGVIGRSRSVMKTCEDIRDQ